MERERIQELPNFFGYTLLYREQVKLRSLFGGYIYRTYRNKSPLKILEKRERERIQGLFQIFWVPPVISGTGKATDFKFGGYIYRANPNRNPLKILEKRERGRIQGLPKFFGYPLLSQERIKLRTSNYV